LITGDKEKKAINCVAGKKWLLGKAHHGAACARGGWIIEKRRGSKTDLLTTVKG